jgi:putative ABC transport system permease protein
MVERAAALPGVVSAGSGMSLPPNRLSITDNFTIEGEEPKTGNFENAVPLVFVDETYFATLGAPVLRGRAFTKADAPGTPGVAIVNAEFAARHFPNTDPIGKPFKTGGAERPDNPYMTIVGVVGNLHYSGVERAADAAFFLPFSQNQWNHNYLVLRTRGDPNALIEPVRQIIR